MQQTPLSARVATSVLLYGNAIHLVLTSTSCAGGCSWLPVPGAAVGVFCKPNLAPHAVSLAERSLRHLPAPAAPHGYGRLHALGRSSLRLRAFMLAWISALPGAQRTDAIA